MIPVLLQSATDIAQSVAERCRARRLALEFTREQLAQRSGVSAASLKRFERSGKIDFGALIRIAIALDALEGFDLLLAKRSYASLDEVIGRPARQRGRRSKAT